MFTLNRTNLINDGVGYEKRLIFFLFQIPNINKRSPLRFINFRLFQSVMQISLHQILDRKRLHTCTINYINECEWFAIVNKHSWLKLHKYFVLINLTPFIAPTLNDTPFHRNKKCITVKSQVVKFLGHSMDWTIYQLKNIKFQLFLGAAGGWHLLIGACINYWLSFDIFMILRHTCW